MTTILTAKPANQTRRTKNLVAKFLREGRYHLIPLYYVMRLSDFAREGIDHSGSYRFADHLYRDKASGRTWFGRWLDRRFLNLPAARAMRLRCSESIRAMSRSFVEHIASGAFEPFRILTVPCGIPRDVRDFAEQLQTRTRDFRGRIAYTGLDLDPAVIAEARKFLHGSAVPEPKLQVGDALERQDYPADPQHFIASTGLGEFLDDVSLVLFYRNVYETLAPGGIFFTSATACDRRADVLLRSFELETHYRTSAEITRLFRAQAWRSVEITQDPSGLQTFVVARK